MWYRKTCENQIECVAGFCWLCDSWFFHTIKYVKKTLLKRSEGKKDIQASATTLRLLRFDKRNRTKTALSSFGFYYYVRQNVQKHCKYLWFVQVEKYTHVRTKSYRLTNSITYFWMVTLGSHSHIITIYSNVVFHFFVVTPNKDECQVTNGSIEELKKK